MTACDNRWPMCGAPTGSECSACADAGKPCYCERPAEDDERVRLMVRTAVEEAEHYDAQTKRMGRRAEDD